MVVPVNSKKPSPVRRFFGDHPMVRWITVTIVCTAVFALVGALINLALSHIPGNSPGANPVPPVQVPYATSQADQVPVATSPAFQTPDASSSTFAFSAPPAPSLSPSPDSTQQANPYSAGTCLAGDFTQSTPQNVKKVVCSSNEAAYKVIKTFPGETDTSVCQGVSGAKLGYLEQLLENVVPIESNVYCLG
jgi:hypothetical protein